MGGNTVYSRKQKKISMAGTENLCVLVSRVSHKMKPEKQAGTVPAKPLDAILRVLAFFFFS